MFNSSAPQDGDIEQGKGKKKQKKMTRKDWVVTIIVAVIILLMGYLTSHC